MVAWIVGGDDTVIQWLQFWTPQSPLPLLLHFRLCTVAALREHSCLREIDDHDDQRTAISYKPLPQQRCSVVRRVDAGGDGGGAVIILAEHGEDNYASWT